jgi:hypothetical protein
MLSQAGMFSLTLSEQSQAFPGLALTTLYFFHSLSAQGESKGSSCCRVTAHYQRSHDIDRCRQLQSALVTRANRLNLNAHRHAQSR